MTTAADLEAGRPLVFRNATVLTMDDGHRVLAGADVLIAGERIAAVGPNLQAPDGGESAEIGPGDTAVFPRGWTGTWQIHETIRKLYVLF